MRGRRPEKRLATSTSDRAPALERQLLGAFPRAVFGVDESVLKMAEMASRLVAASRSISSRTNWAR